MLRHSLRLFDQESEGCFIDVAINPDRRDHSQAYALAGFLLEQHPAVFKAWSRELDTGAEPDSAWEKASVLAMHMDDGAWSEAFRQWHLARLEAHPWFNSHGHWVIRNSELRLYAARDPGITSHTVAVTRGSPSVVGPVEVTVRPEHWDETERAGVGLVLAHATDPAASDHVTILVLADGSVRSGGAGSRSFLRSRLARQGTIDVSGPLTFRIEPDGGHARVWVNGVHVARVRGAADQPFGFMTRDADATVELTDVLMPSQTPIPAAARAE